LPSDIALNVSTTYTDTGLKQAQKDIKGMGDSVDDFASKNERLIKRIERPIAAIAYSGIANDMLDMGQKGESGTAMLEHGLHAAGNALLFFNPALGIAVIAGTALFEVFQKMAASAHLTADEIQKIIDKNNKTAKSFRDAAEEAKKSGERADIVKSLLDQANALDGLTQHTKDQAKAQVDLARENLRAILLGQDRASLDEKTGVGHVVESERLKRVAAAQKTLNDEIAAYTAVLAENAKAQKTKEDEWQILTRQIQASKTLMDQQKLMTQYRDIDMAKVQDVIKIDQENTDLSLKLADTRDEKERQLLEHHIAYNQARRQSDLEMLANEKSNIDKIASEIEKYTHFLTGNISKVNGVIVVDTAKMFQGLITETTTNLAKGAYAWAAYWIAQGNFGQAAVATAEGLAIETLGAVASAAIGPGTSTGSTSTANGNLGVNSLNPGASSSNAGTTTQLTVNVQGGIMDDQFAANLAKRLSDVVQQGNVTLVASKVN